jgi:hypothetical protein
MTLSAGAKNATSAVDATSMRYHFTRHCKKACELRFSIDECSVHAFVNAHKSVGAFDS